MRGFKTFYNSEALSTLKVALRRPSISVSFRVMSGNLFIAVESCMRV